MMATQTQEALVSGADPGSYEAFVEARSAALYRKAYLLTGNRADAEDLVQVALVKLFVAWRRASRAPSTDAYAFKVLVNAFVSGRRPVRFTRERLVSELPESVAAQSPVEDRMVLWPLVHRLPPKQRAVVVLRYLDDLTEGEIADVLGIAPGTVKSTASAAMKNLRSMMSETGVER